MSTPVPGEPGYVRLALEQRCKGEDNWPLSRWDRWRLTAKFVICRVLLPQRRVYCAHPLNHVDVAVFDGHTYGGPDGTFSNWSVLAVGKGWRNWRWEATTDGD